MAILNNSNAISSGGYDINNSLRFRSSASAYLNRTPASAGNRQIFTWSGWVKRGALDSGSEYTLFSAGAGSPNYDSFRFTINQLQFFQGAGSVSAVQTTQVFRDPSAWYHLVLAVDTTQATAANRIKMYVNGNQITAFASAAYPTQNTSATINNTNAHAVGALWITSPQQYIDGYLAEVNFIDGQQLTPSSFGETDTTTGSWKPKAYTGTYGTNGFYLKFSDIATTSGSNAGLGKDFSGNANYWTTNNISVTAGTTYDAMIDSPTLTSATVANYCVINPLKVAGTLSNANLTYTNSSGASWQDAFGTFMVSSGKWYWEGTVSLGIYHVIGVATSEITTTYDWGTPSSGSAWGYIDQNGNKLGPSNYGAGAAYGATYTSGDVIGVALDLDTGTITFYKNGVSQGTAFSTNLAGTLVTPIFSVYDTSRGWSVNFGQRPFTYTPPSGFVALNTYNLPDSTVVKGNTVMDATLYTGTGASLSVTNTGAFKPDFVWVKGRSGATDHALYDSVRGTTKDLVSNSTAAETTQAQGLTAFGTGGFTVGTLAKMNTSAATYVGWQWQAGAGSSASNTSGSITSTVSVNTTAGFSVVTYTGTGANATVGHGLGVAPKMIINKRRNSTSNFNVHHTSIPAANSLYLNLTNASQSDPTVWNSTLPTSSVFSIGTDNSVSGGTYVSYCWAEIAGFSKFGSYVGNGSTDGTFVYLGFRPAFVMVKTSSGTADWLVFDSKRVGYNVNNDNLAPNLSRAEDGTDVLDLLSNGFKFRLAGYPNNADTFIYMAFAESPFKSSLAR